MPTYSLCLNCGMTDAPGCHVCMTCYMRGEPYQMEQIKTRTTPESALLWAVDTILEKGAR